MKANVKKRWNDLCREDQKVIEKVVDEEVYRRSVQIGYDLQKLWIKLGCIVNYDCGGWARLRNMRWLRQWKKIYRKLEQFETTEERDAWIEERLNKIFGKDGFPTEWLDSLENGGKK